MVRILGVICVLTLSAYYTIAPETEGMITVLIQVLFSSLLLGGLMSIQLCLQAC